MVETDNPLVSPLFNREARKKLMSPAGGRDGKKEDILETPSTPYISKQPTKVKPIPPPDFSNVDSHVTASPLDNLRRPTPKKTPQAHSDYLDALYDQPGTQSTLNPTSLLPKCTKPGVYTIPSLASLQKMPEHILKELSNFTIKKDNVGSIKFLKPVDVRGLDLDAIVEFYPTSIVVYPNEDEKPEPGRGLNTNAIISLESCFPVDPTTGRTSTNEADISRFVRRLQSMSRVNLASNFPRKVCSL